MKTTTLLASILVAAILLFGCAQQQPPAPAATLAVTPTAPPAATAAVGPTVTETQQGASEPPGASASMCAGTEDDFDLTCSDQPPAGAGCEVNNLGERQDCMYPMACYAVKCAEATPSPTPFFASPSPQASGALSGEVTIHIKNFAFEPAEVTVKKGSRITWINDDTVGHTVTSEAGKFAFPDSATLSWNQQYSNVFVNMGTYNYHCNIHPNMKGKIIVVE